MHKNKTKKQNPLNEDVQFCTECGSELDEFCFKDQAANKEFLKRNHENCIKIGKFKGDVCSRLYIASDNDIDEIFLYEE
jgi:hypothetical protein